MIKKFKFLFFIMVSMFVFSLCLADIIGTKTDENYTYTSDWYEDVILTSTMVFTSDYSIQLDTETATGLTVKGTDENYSCWLNDASLFINGNVGIDNIYLLNESSLTANILTISSNSFVETVADNLISQNGIINNGIFYIAGGENINVIIGSGTTMFTNVSSETFSISTNNATIEQLSVINESYLYNKATITTEQLINAGYLITNISTINLVSTNTIKNEGYLEITGGTNTYTITGSNGIIVFGNADNSITGNTGEIIQSTMYVQGIFVNEGKITIAENIINFENSEFSTDISSISVTNNSIVNFGKLNLSGDGENNNYINGYYQDSEEETGIMKGTTTITGNITNNNVIAQSYIINKGTITTSLENIYATDKLINDGKIIINGNESYNFNIIEGTEGKGILEISTNVANAANIKQKELLINTDVSFYNKSNIELSSFTNNGTFINELENEDESITEGTISADKIINTGFIRTNIENLQTTNEITNEGVLYLYITDITNDTEIIGSSGTTILVNTSSQSISTNSANIHQYGLAIWGSLYNQATITVSSFTNNGIFYTDINNINLVSTDTIVNENVFYITGGINNYNIIGSSGILVFNSNTEEVSTNSANIIQYELASQGEFYNEANITAEIYENYGLTYSSGTIEVSSFTNNGDFINQSNIISEYFENTIITDSTNVISISRLQNSGNITVSNKFINDGIFLNGFEGTGGTINAAEIVNNYNLVTNIENIQTTSNEIKNNGYLEITGGTNTYKITGSSGIISFGGADDSITRNMGEIIQSTMYVQGIFTNEEKIELSQALVILTSGTMVNKSSITSLTIFNSGDLTNNGKIKTLGVENALDGTFETDINNIETNSFTNLGKLNLTGNGINNIYIVAITTTNVLMGTTKITGQITNNNVIAQSYIINEGSITTNYQIYADTITNNGYMNFANNTYNEEYYYYHNYSVIKGTGSLEISTNVVNTAFITQKQLIVNENTCFQTTFYNLSIEEGIINNGLIYSVGGTNTNTITGSSGTFIFNISTETVSTNSANITQYEVASQGEFYNEATITAENYENYGMTYSSGIIEVSSFTNKGTFFNEFEGTGGTISAAEVINNYNLVTNIENIQTTSNEIKNNGYLEITGGTNRYKITGSSGIVSFGSDENSIVGNINEIQQSTMYVQGIFTNEGKVELTENLIILTSASLTNISTITAKKDVYNYGTIINKSSITSPSIFFNNGNLNNEATIYSTNYFINYGTTTNMGEIITIEMDNATGGVFETDIKNIKVSSIIINYGSLILNGNETNNNYITGLGTTTINGDVTNNNILAQNCIINYGTVTTKLEHIYADSIQNYGKMTISENSQYHYNTNNFEGTGILEISTSIYNTANIQQNSVILSSSSEFYTKADLLDVANLQNDGFMIFSEESTVNKSTITGSGILYLLGNIESSGQINQSAVVIYQNYSLTTDGDKLNSKYIINNGVLTLSNGNINLIDTFFGGAGRIVGDIVIGSSSTLSPGNSIGYVFVRGNLTFDSNSIYSVEFSEEDSDYTQAYGNLTINPGSKADFVNLYGKYFEHKTYDILFTTNTLSGSFDEISLSGYDVDVSSISDLKEARIAFSTKTVDGAMQVTLARKGTEYSTSSQLIDMTSSQKAVAEAIDIISLKSNTGSIASLLSTLENYYYYNSTYNIEKIKEIFTSLSGTIYANSAMAPFLNARYEHIYDKIYKTEEVKDYVDEYYEDDEEYYEAKRNIWTQYYYNYYDVSGNQNYSSYDNTVQGFYAGYDISTSKNKLLGIVIGYADGLLKQEYDQTKVKSANIGAYVGYSKNKFQLKSLAMLGYDMYETERQTRATADYNGYNFSFDAEASYSVILKEKFEIKPFAGVLTNISKQDSFSEKNAQSLNLSVAENTNFLSQARVGAEVKGKINLLNWYARFGIKQFLTQNYSETTIKITDTGTGFNLKGTELSSTIFNIGFGGDYYLSEYWTAFANIHFGIGSGNSNDYYGNLGIKYKFGVINREKDYIIR